MKPVVRLSIYLFLFIQVLPVVIFGQDENLQNIELKFQKYNQANLQEKLFVHTDKSFYLAGEILWFKIYDVSGAANKLFDFSKIAYVEIYGTDQSPFYRQRYP